VNTGKLIGSAQYFLSVFAFLAFSFMAISPWVVMQSPGAAIEMPLPPHGLVPLRHLYYRSFSLSENRRPSEYAVGVAGLFPADDV